MVEWNVWYYSFNADEFKRFNILRDHASFIKYVKKYKNKYDDDKKEFEKKLRSEIFYYFGGKTEWEVIITYRNSRIIMTPWCGRRCDTSLDVTDDPNFDWPSFYVWIKERKCADKDGSIKIDVYDQVMYKFEEFTNYCWQIKGGDMHRKCYI